VHQLVYSALVTSQELDKHILTLQEREVAPLLRLHKNLWVEDRDEMATLSVQLFQHTLGNS
jgi:hypothetical protein